MMSSDGVAGADWRCYDTSKRHLRTDFATLQEKESHCVANCQFVGRKLAQIGHNMRQVWQMMSSDGLAGADWRCYDTPKHHLRTDFPTLKEEVSHCVANCQFAGRKLTQIGHNMRQVWADAIQ